MPDDVDTRVLGVAERTVPSGSVDPGLAWEAA